MAARSKGGVLVAAPTFDGHAYALDRWQEAYEALDYDEKALLLVDTTKGSLDYAHVLRSRGVPTVHIEPMPHLYDTIESAWQVIAAEAAGYEWVLSLETDVIAPSLTIFASLALADCHKAEIIAHGYPLRRNQTQMCHALGCTLIRSRWLERTHRLWPATVEHAVLNDPRTYRALLLRLEHLDAPEAEG